MLKTRLIALFDYMELPLVDGPSIIAEIVSNPVYWIDNADKLEQYKGLSPDKEDAAGSHSKLECGTIIVKDSRRDMYTVSSVVNVRRSMLTGLLSDQLGYVPELAVLEFYMGIEAGTIMCRETIVCSALEECGGIRLAALSNTSVAEDVAEAFAKTPDLTKVWLHVALATVKKLGWTFETPTGHVNNMHVSVFQPTVSNYVH